MRGHDLERNVADDYRAFAEDARGRSPHYESLAASVAEDADVLGFLESLPRHKRQPNLLFAAARYLLGAPATLDDLRTLVNRNPAGLWQLMLSRRTQTNEPARCATLLPALAQLPPPLALIEVGASAGLTLLVDRYSYDYAGRRIAGRDRLAPTLRCEPRGSPPLPTAVPEIVWRAGLDLNPLDVGNDDDVRWLSCLVWPGEDDRAERLTSAIEAARRAPPAVHRGDLVTDLPALGAQAPAHATLVVFHSAVLAYVTPDDRRRFATAVRDLGAVWLSNESPGVVPGLAAPPHEGSPFLLARDGRIPLAFADGHGSWIQWLADTSPGN